MHPMGILQWVTDKFPLQTVEWKFICMCYLPKYLAGEESASHPCWCSSIPMLVSNQGRFYQKERCNLSVYLPIHPHIYQSLFILYLMIILPSTRLSRAGWECLHVASNSSVRVQAMGTSQLCTYIECSLQQPREQSVTMQASLKDVKIQPLFTLGTSS